MSEFFNVLEGGNGIAILIILVIFTILLLVFGRHGYFSFTGKGLRVGRTEGELRTILLKQKEFLLQYCSYLTLTIISDLSKLGIELSYVSVDYVVEKVVDEWLGWLLVNHILEEEAYVSLKVKQTKLIMLKAVGRVNSQLLQDENLVSYFDNLCERVTKEIIKGILSVYRNEGRVK